MSTAAALQYSRSAGRQQRLVIDRVIVAAVFGLLLAGLVMVTSASMNIAERLTGDPYFHFERHLFSSCSAALRRGNAFVRSRVGRFAPGA